MIAFPNAKINLGLYIVEKRPDNFHNIETVFFPIHWQDVVEIHSSTKETSFQSYGLSIDATPEQNLCVKAWNLLHQSYKIPPVDIHLLKNIPMGAGLGGGSSDAAYCLKLLNEINQLNLSNHQLVEFAAQLGSDCAFFIENKPVFASQRGENLAPISLSLKGYQILVVHPGIHISTPWAFQQIQPQKANFDLRNLADLPLIEWKNKVENQFETVVFPAYPLIEEIKNSLYHQGAVYAAMSGSGSACFGIFPNNIQIDLTLYKNYTSHLSKY